MPSYTPVQPGISNAFKDSVSYHEYPPAAHSYQVYCYWELQTKQPLDTNFIYEALPDGCTDIIFKSGDLASGIVMAPSESVERIDLGKVFHFIGIRLRTGFWRHNEQVIDKQAPLGQFTALQDIEVPMDIKAPAARASLDAIVAKLIAVNCLREHSLTALLQIHSAELRSVEDMIHLSGYGRRQLQRIVKEETGLTPKNLLSVMRFQELVRQPTQPWRYSDQPHISRDFLKRTGLTPKGFRRKFSRSLSDKP